MEQKNLCTLTGFVGSITRKTVSGKLYAIASVATHFTTKNAANESVKETSWHDVKLWEGKKISADDLNALEKGTKVTITGRVVNEKYTRANGEEFSQTVISAASLEIIDSKDTTTENKIELVGRVGNVRESVVGGTNIIRLCLATNHVYKSKDNCYVEEVTWHNVNIFTGTKFPAEKMSQINTGTPLSVIGRLQCQNYNTPNGETRKIVNVIPVEVEILETEKSAE